MDKKIWDTITKEDFIECKKMLEAMEAELLKYPGEQAFEYLKPIRYLISEALSDLLTHKRNRIEDVNDIIQNIQP